MPSAFLVLGFGSILLAGLLLVSSLRNRGIGEVLDGLTSPNVEGAQETLGANTGGPTASTAPPLATTGKNAAFSNLSVETNAGKGGTHTEKELVANISRKQGWSAQAWEDIIELESGWNPAATNPSSGAFGIGQFLGSTKREYARYGATSSNPLHQIEAMSVYIQKRYGNPTAALAFHRANGWY